VPNWPDGTYFWGAVPIVDGEVLYVIGVRVRGVNPIGNYLAEFDAKTLAYRQTVAVPGGTTVWGGQVRASTGWWISGSHGVACQYATDCKVADMAFVPFGELSNPTAWKVHGDVIPAAENLGTTLGIRSTSSGWDAWTKQGDMYGGSNIIRLKARSPLGPWALAGQWPASVATAGDVTYAVAVHPEQPAPKGHMLVTYAENGTTYHPWFLYLPL
jgi:hypothetical protein